MLPSALRRWLRSPRSRWCVVVATLLCVPGVCDVLSLVAAHRQTDKQKKAAAKKAEKARKAGTTLCTRTPHTALPLLTCESFVVVRVVCFAMWWCVWVWVCMWPPAEKAEKKRLAARKLHIGEGNSKIMEALTSTPSAFPHGISPFFPDSGTAEGFYATLDDVLLEVTMADHSRAPKIAKGTRDFGPEQMQIRDKCFRTIRVRCAWARCQACMRVLTCRLVCCLAPGSRCSSATAQWRSTRPCSSCGRR